MIVKILKYIIIYIILIVSFIGLMTLASSFSSKKIYSNVKESSEILFSESNKKNIYIPYRGDIIQFDNCTDSLMINTAYSIDYKMPLYSAFVARKNYISNKTTKIFEETLGELKFSSKYEEVNAVGELKDLVNGEIWESFEYARYWHGYLIILRPLLILFNLETIRVLLTIFLIVLAIIFLKLLAKKINTIVAIVFFIGLLFSEYFFLGFSLQGIFIFIIMMISSITILTRLDKIKDLGILFFITGILTNFFDFLTVPLLTLGLPLITYTLLTKKNATIINKNLIINIIKLSIIWGIGYGLTWLTKWILTDLLFEKQLIKTSIEQVFYRMGTQEYKITTTLKQNILYMLSGFSIMLFITVLATDIRMNFYKNKKITQKIANKKEILINNLPYMIIGVFPLIWYILLRNHSYHHAFFTYRNLLLTNICLGICLEQSYEKIIIKKSIRKKTNL